MLSSSRGSTLRSLTLALALCAFMAPAARAQVGFQTGPVFEISAFGGYYIASDIYTSIGNTAGNGATIGLENSPMYGARLGVVPNPRFGLEFVYSRIGSDLKVMDTVPGYTPGTDLGRINGNSYDVDFLFLQPTGSPHAVGYFTLGFGWTVTDPDIQPSPTPGSATPESNSLFAWNFGAGAKVDLTRRILLRLEGRWRVTDTAVTTSTGVYCDYWGYCYGYSSDWYNSGEFTAGLTLRFGSGVE